VTAPPWSPPASRWAGTTATSSRVTGRVYRNSVLRTGARVGLLEALRAIG
jgi:hypothetical protein